jgi:hypothetical protein
MFGKSLSVSVFVVSFLFILVSTAPASVTHLTDPAFLNPLDTTIDFEDGFSTGVLANDFYNPPVRFSRDDEPDGLVSLLEYNNAHSGSVVLISSGPSIGPNRYPYTSTNTVPSHLNLEFSSPVSEIGAYFGFNSGDSPFDMTLSIFDEGHVLIDSFSLETEPGLNINQFIGMKIDDEHSIIKYVLFQHNGDSTIPVVIDDLTFSNVVQIVPAPSAALMAGIGIASVTWLRRRRAI